MTSTEADRRYFDDASDASKYVMKAFYITERQHCFLEERKWSRRMSRSELLREAIDRLIEEEGRPPERR